MAQSESENWQAEAKREQCEFYTSWGHRVVWRGVPAEMKSSLQLMIASHLFQKTANQSGDALEQLGLSRQQISNVRIIANKMIKYFPDQFVHVRVLFISAHHRGDTWGEIVFKVEGGGVTKLIDPRFRVYHDWASFLEGNNMRPCEMLFPTNGIYELAPSGMEVLVTLANSPSSSRKKRILALIEVIASLFLFLGLLLGAVFAFTPEILVLAILGGVFAIGGALFLAVMAVIGFIDALKYS